MIATLPLGRSGRCVSRIAFGCAAIGGWDYGPADDAMSVRAVRAALDAGVTLFDTADVYGFGHAEEVLSRALGDDRRRVVLATKCGIRWNDSGRTTRDLSPAYVVRAVHASLRRLRVDCIDLMQLHWPDGSTPIEATLDAMSRLQRDGVIAHLGCCNFPSELVDRAQRVTRLETQQVPLSCHERDWAECAQWCAAQYEMAVLCYNVLAQGVFSGKFDRNVRFPATDLRSRSHLLRGEAAESTFASLERLRAAASTSGRTTAQEAIRWVLEQDGVSVAIVGARSPEQVLENCGAIDLRAGVFTPDP